MNKFLILLIVPCFVAFVIVQGQSYGGAGGYGGLGQAAFGYNQQYGNSLYGQSPAYYTGAYARTQLDAYKYLSLIAGALGLFAFWFAVNGTGGIAG